MAITRLPSGSWRVEIYRPRATRIRKSFKTREEARKYEAIFKGELSKGNDEVLQTFNAALKGEVKTAATGKGDLSFEEYLTSWHLARQQGQEISLNYARRIDDYFKKQIFPVLGDCKLSEINSQKIRELRNSLFETYSKQTIKNMEMVIKKALRDAVGDGLIPFYPLGNLSQITVKHSEAKEVLPWCYEDQKKLMNAARSYSDSVNDQRRFILFYTALNTGMRYGELAGLKWRDINLEQKSISVERQCIYAEGDTKPLLSDLKTQSSRRQIFLTDEDASAIRQYRAWVYKNCVSITNKDVPPLLLETPFIPHDNGLHIPKHFGRTTLKALCREAGVNYRSFHTLRHTHATNLANTGVPVKQLSDRLGHSSVTTTMDRYSKATREAIEPFLVQINVKDA